MKRIYCCLFIFLLLCFVPLARAQSTVDVALGFGSASNSANGSGIDNINSPNAFGSCSLSTGDTFCQATPSLGGFFMGLGGDVMLEEHYGLGGEISFQPTKHDFGPLQSRELFYDFDGIYAPVSVKRGSLRLLGGFGGSRTSFSFSQSACVGTAVCSTQATSVGNSNHFQLHLGIGVELLPTEHIFVRPQFDFHYVPGFTDQFGRNTVPGAMIWIGYRFGGS
jgi:Outer membrane protein beta-barrel domain